MKVSIVVCSMLLASVCLAQPMRGSDETDKPSAEMPSALRNKPKAPEDLDALVEIAHSTSAAVRRSHREAALALISNPDPQAGRGLARKYEKLLDDEDQDVRSMAAIGCGAIGDKDAIPKLRQMLKAVPKHAFDPNQGLDYSEYRASMGAASALAALGDQASAPEILSRETLAPSWEMLLPKFGARSIPEVVERARSAREGVRNGALKTLAAFRDSESVPQLKALLAGC